MAKKLYTTKFECIAKPVSNEKGKKMISSAAISNIKSLIPEIIEANEDLLPVAFDAYVANVFNLNGDGANGVVAKKLAPLFVNKPINLDHETEDVVGVITSYAFTDRESGDELTEAQLESKIKEDEPFNVTLGGVIWKRVNDSIASLIEESNDENSDLYSKISASWEVAFSEFQIGVINKDEIEVSKAKFETDEKKAKGLLNVHNQIIEGKRIVRLVGEDSLGVGIGLTDNPAGDVSGVTAKVERETETKASIDYDSIKENVLNTVKEEILSQSKKTNVTNRKDMENPETPQDITQEWLASAEVKSVRSWVASYINEKLGEASLKYEADIEAKDGATAKQKEDYDNLVTSSEELQAKFDELTKTFESLSTKNDERESKDLLNVRVAELEEEYALDDEDRKAIIQSIAGLDEEKFDAFKKSILATLLKDKSKAVIAEKAKIEASKKEENEDKSTTDFKKILSTAEKEEGSIPNTTDNFMEDGIAKKLEASFSPNETIK
tara:strand:+ start:103649 stop:105139 length:1491 start_codon:yes stop_codon:yes gene_type:complete